MAERVTRCEVGGRRRLAMGGVGCSAGVRRRGRKHGGLFVDDDHRARISSRLRFYVPSYTCVCCLGKDIALLGS